MKLYHLIFSLIIVASTFGQTVNYGGSVTNNDLQEDFLIILYNIKDNSLIYSQNSINNNFLFLNIVKGEYKRCITSNLYNQCDTISLDLTKENDIINIEKGHQLDEIIINKKKPLIENIDGILKVNIENSPIMTTGSIFETLSKLPGVSYNQSNENFKLKGKDGIQIQMDGQTIFMTGNELTTFLKNIPSADISNIEINSSPSAKYDAGGSAGIINVNTKTIKKKGINIGTSLSATMGKYYRQNLGLKSQYNTKKQRFMLYYINSFDTDFEKVSTVQNFTNTNTLQETFAKIYGNTNTLKGQFENKFSKSNLIIHSSISFYNEDIKQNTALFIYNNNAANSNVFSKQESNNKLKNFDLGANYNLNLENSKLTLKSNYIQYDINNYSYLKSIETPPVNLFNDLQNSSPNKINLFVNQIDFEHKIDSLSRFETGIKNIYQNINNANEFYQNINNKLTFDANKSNGYLYNEQIFALYLQYYRTVKKFDFILGSRIEYNPSKGYENKNDYTLKREQTNFFPFFNIIYNHSDLNNFNLSYSKRINRPSFGDLMPFIYYVDPFTQLQGNPNLNSDISNQFELQYIHKENYIFSLSYSLIINPIYQTPIQDSDTLKTVLLPLNINKIQSLALNTNLTFEITKWWSLNLNAIGFYDSVLSNKNSINIDSKNLSLQLVKTNSFSLPKEIKFELSSDYVSPFIQGPYKTNSLILINVSLSKSFFNNKMSLSITGNDILKTYKIKNRSIIDNQKINSIQTSDSHFVRLSIVYKFNKGLEKENTPEDKTTEELKSRIK